MEPQGSVWLPSRFLVPGTQERAQRRSCLYTKCTEERSGDAVMGGGWMSRDGGGEGNLNISGFGLLSQAHYQQFWGEKI